MTMAEGLRCPGWWKGDFDTTGKTQLGWAKEAAAGHPKAGDQICLADAAHPGAAAPRHTVTSVTPAVPADIEH